jgi:replicative DNA helicase
VNKMMKVPPQNLDAEVSVLGGVLLNNDAFHDLDGLKPADFYKEGHKLIFEGMMDLFDTGQPIDIVTLSEHLTKKGIIQKAGGATYLADILNEVPTAANIKSYSTIVKEKATLRNLIISSTAIIEKSHRAEEPVKEILDWAEGTIFEVSSTKANETFSPLSETISATFRHIEDLVDRDDAITGVPSGFIDVDKVTAGFQKSNLIILAARPGMGKTTLALNIATRSAIRANARVAVFTLEMSKEELTMRLLSSEARIEGERLKTGRLFENDWPKLTKAAADLSEAKIYIDSTNPLTVMDMRSKLRRLKARDGLDLVLVDYLQLMESYKKHGSKEQEISEISKGLKRIAMEFGCPVIALSQLSRRVESRDDKRPILSDLRESGSIEQDADIVGFLYRDEYYNEDSPDKGTCEFLFRKHRSGSLGTVHLHFTPKYTLFDDLAR